MRPRRRADRRLAAYTLMYTRRMVPIHVLTMRELREGLADVVDEVSTGGPVFAGARRKPEVVIMSVQHYEQLSADQQLAVDSALGSAAAEGLHLTDAEVAALRDYAAGRITRAQYQRRVLPQYFPPAG